jgi:transient receptor potential cation channel subfamily C protein 4
MVLSKFGCYVCFQVSEQLNLSTSRSYTPDITPVILAAHRDNYEIVKILLERGMKYFLFFDFQKKENLFSGEKVTEPHDVRCDCEKCLVYNKEDSLRHSRSRINAYKALSSPCYISLSSRDPIMTAFDLYRELKRLSRIENEFKQEYEQLAQQCQDYSAALLAETRSSKELEIILNYDSENPPVLVETTEKMTLARLKLAIRYKQKKVKYLIDDRKRNYLLFISLFHIHIVNNYLLLCGMKVYLAFDVVIR